MLESLLSLLLAACFALAIEVRRFLRQKREDEHLESLLSRLNDAAFGAVAASAGSEATPPEQAQVKQAAIDSVKAQLGVKGLADLSKATKLPPGEAIDKLISAHVEAAMYQLQLRRV